MCSSVYAWIVRLFLILELPGRFYHQGVPFARMLPLLGCSSSGACIFLVEKQALWLIPLPLFSDLFFSILFFLFCSLFLFFHSLPFSSLLFSSQVFSFQRSPFYRRLHIITSQIKAGAFEVQFRIYRSSHEQGGLRERFDAGFYL